MSTIHYNFVGSSASGDDLDFLRALPWEEGTIMCARHAWVWPLYCQLKMRGMLVSFSFELVPDAINIIHGQVARNLLQPADFRNYFIIAIRADFRPFPYGQFEIVQNRYVAGGRRVFMPHFPQPGLRVRDKGRERVENVCFAGQANNCFDASSLPEDLKQLSCRFVVKGEGDWQNMQDVDLLLGIRSLSKKKYHSKPPTKLFNAWFAGIPFIGGYDSAYEQVGTLGKNYLRVATYSELLEAIQLLKKDTKLYQHLVREGFLAAQAYTPDRITDCWLDFLEKEMAPAYHRWVNRIGHSGMRGWVMAAMFASNRLMRRVIEVVRDIRPQVN